MLRLVNRLALFFIVFDIVFSLQRVFLFHFMCDAMKKKIRVMHMHQCILPRRFIHAYATIYPKSQKKKHTMNNNNNNK